MRAAPIWTSSAGVSGSALRVWVTRRTQAPQCIFSMVRFRVAMAIRCGRRGKVAGGVVYPPPPPFLRKIFKAEDLGVDLNCMDGAGVCSQGVSGRGFCQVGSL